MSIKAENCACGSAVRMVKLWGEVHFFCTNPACRKTHSVKGTYHNAKREWNRMQKESTCNKPGAIA